MFHIKILKFSFSIENQILTFGMPKDSYLSTLNKKLKKKNVGPPEGLQLAPLGQGLKTGPTTND